MLKALWYKKEADGTDTHSTMEIAFLISGEAKEHLTKNAVIGAAHRLDLERRGSPIRRSDGTVQPLKPRRPKPIPLKAFPPVAPVVKAPFTKLSVVKPPVVLRPPPVTCGKPCQWPFGDPKEKDFRFCGDSCRIDSSYCPKHHEDAYVKVERPSFLWVERDRR